jgi:5-methylcytosine-specific restriction endonuclease McrA
VKNLHLLCPPCNVRKGNKYQEPLNTDKLD